MTNWLERAKREIPQESAGQTTDVTDETNLTAVMARQGESRISRASIGCNGSSPMDDFREINDAAEITHSMTAAEEAAIRTWMTHINEIDTVIIADVLGRCHKDAKARDYFIRRVSEVPESD